MKLNKRQILAAALSVALGVPVGAQALTFTGGTDTVSNVAVFDWGPFTVFGDGGLDAVAASLNQGPGCGTDCVFDAYAHGSLSAFQDASNTPIASGLGTDYEVTFVLGFSEKVIETFHSAITGNITASFGFGPSGKTSGFDVDDDAVMKDGSPNFFRMYVDTNVNADPLNGTGYDDGTLILSGQILPDGSLISGYTASSNERALKVDTLGNDITPAPWTSSGSGGYTTRTLEGSGNTSDLNVFVGNTDYDSSAFGGEEITGFLMSNISQVLPFKTTDPSLSFPEMGINITNVKDKVSGNGDHVNGKIDFTASGAVAQNGSIIFQSDTNSPVASIPAPATIALMGLGLIGLGGLGHRARKA